MPESIKAKTANKNLLCDIWNNILKKLPSLEKYNYDNVIYSDCFNITLCFTNDKEFDKFSASSPALDTIYVNMNKYIVSIHSYALDLTESYDLHNPASYDLIANTVQMFYLKYLNARIESANKHLKKFKKALEEICEDNHNIYIRTDRK